MRRIRGYREIFLVFILLFPVFAKADDQDSTIRNSNHKFNFAVYPAAGYKPETSFLLGLVGIVIFSPPKGSDARYNRPATITPYCFYTFRNQFLSYLDMEMYPKNIYYYNGTFRYWNYPDQYFGIGKYTSGVNEEYTDRIIKFEGNFGRIIKEKILAGIAFQLQNNHLSNVKENGFLDTANVSGKSGGNVLGFGPHLRFDNRNNTLYTTKGFYFESYLYINPHWNLSHYSFTTLVMDFRAFTHVFSKKDILAIQAYFASTNGNNIPFYMLPKLGGDQRLRGIEHENRYIDRNAYYIQAEGRRHLFWRFGGVLFAGLGGVDKNLNEFSFRSLKFVYGIGGRFQPIKSQLLNLRLDAGKGPGKQYAIYFSLNEAF